MFRAPRFALLLALASLLACGLFGSRAPAAVDVTVVASGVLNPDEQGRSLPTVVRFYVLRNAAKLERSDYGPVYGQPKETLGEDVIFTEEITVLPGETVSRRLERGADARAVAAVALFRRPAGDSWRAVVELPAGGRRIAVTFAAEGYRIEHR